MKEFFDYLKTQEPFFDKEIHTLRVKHKKILMQAYTKFQAYLAPPIQTQLLESLGDSLEKSDQNRSDLNISTLLKMAPKLTTELNRALQQTTHRQQRFNLSKKPFSEQLAKPKVHKTPETTPRPTSTLFGKLSQLKLSSTLR